MLLCPIFSFIRKVAGVKLKSTCLCEKYITSGAIFTSLGCSHLDTPRRVTRTMTSAHLPPALYLPCLSESCSKPGFGECWYSRSCVGISAEMRRDPVSITRTASSRVGSMSLYSLQVLYGSETPLKTALIQACMLLSDWTKGSRAGWTLE